MSKILAAAKVPAMTLGAVTGIGYGLATGWWLLTTLGCLLIPFAACHAKAHAKWVLIGATLLMIGLVLRIATFIPLHDWWPLFVAFGVAVTGATGLWWHHHRTATAGKIRKQGKRSLRNGGVASPWAVLKTGWSVRSQATTLCPSLKGLSWWRLQRVPLSELGIPLGRVWLFRAWSTFRHCVLYLGGTGMGKSGKLGDVVLSAPKTSAVLCASRRLDLLGNTGALRGENGKPVLVYNPGGLGGIESTLTFDPLTGCEDPEVAIKRAIALLSGTKLAGGERGPEWTEQGARMLAPFLHAAAYTPGATIDDVNSWVTNPAGSYEIVMNLLSRSPQGSFRDDLTEYAGMGGPQSSVKMTIRAAFAWVTSPAARASAAPSDFNVEKFLDGGTVYLLGDNDDTVAPLVTAFTTYIAKEAERIAQLRGGRLDPPLVMVLDEVVNCCPIPLVEWSAFFGGMGILLHVAAQSISQLEGKYGVKPVGELRTNMNTIMIFGGTKDPTDLASHVQLLGTRQEALTFTDGAGRTTVSAPALVPVMSEDQVSRVPPFSAVILDGIMPTAIARTQMVWERSDYQRAHRAARRVGVPSWIDRLRSLRSSRGVRPVVGPARQPIAALPVGYTEQARLDRLTLAAMENEVAAQGTQQGRDGS